MLIAHISDLHFGRLTDGSVVDALVRDVNASRPDVVVVSGDLTQRSRLREWAGARSFMDALDTRPIVIPGNHDVFAWWFPLRRLFAPLRRYRAFVGGDLDSFLRIDSVAFVALSAAWGWTVKGGVFKHRQVDRMKSFLHAHRDATRRVLIVHHPIQKSRFTGRGDVALRSRYVLDAAAETGVDIVLDGHIHCAGVEILHTADRSMIHCMAGTATSDRGRFEDVGVNRYSLVRLDGDVSIEQRRYVAAKQQFVADGTVTLVRVETGWRENAPAL